MLYAFGNTVTRKSNRGELNIIIQWHWEVEIVLILWAPPKLKFANGAVSYLIAESVVQQALVRAET